MNPITYRIIATAATSWLLACSAVQAQRTQGCSRAEVEAEAVAAAAAPDQNVTSGSRVNSKVISTMRTNDDRARASVQTNPAR